MHKSSFIPASACAILALLALNHSAAQQTTDAGRLVENKNFIFVAQSVTPNRGGLRQLTSEYDLTITKDSLISNLPYFGRAFSAPMNTAQNGFVFTATNFTYTVKTRKKKGWEITIQPKGAQDVRQLALTVFDNGSSSLRVSSNNREAISFNGFVKARGQ